MRKLTSVTLPQSLVVINRMNFFSCNALSEVTIPAGVRYIGDTSFRFCDALRKITFEGVCPAIDMDCFTILPEDAVAYVPDDQLEAYTAAFENAGSTVSVQPSGKNAVIVENNGYVEDEFDLMHPPARSPPTTLRHLPVHPRDHRRRAGEGHRPRGVRAPHLSGVFELPEGLETIGDSAFYNCETLGRVRFPPR